MKNKLIIITGPTAVGKTALSVKLAKRINGEIISADSMQIYKGMDIGTAKVTSSEADGIKHYLVDVLEPTQDFNVFEFKKMAKEACDTINAKGKIPIVAGGTGFYIRALLYDADFEETGDIGIRKRLEKEAHIHGGEMLFDRLKEVDPEYSLTVHPNNLKRVIRALEYFEQTGERFSEYNRRLGKKESPYDFHYYVLTDDREVMYSNIDKRVDKMITQGLVDEVKNLLEKGISPRNTSMQAIGYKEITEYLENRCTLDEAVASIKQNTRHYAKRQLTWFRKEKAVCFIDKRDFDRDDEKILDHMIGEIYNG
ncbi:MAG: tRNA (adenosine(37)-N6)-dimethylallyltransferase MiaA [Lachnospiraceae bacterium]|nr:tRNA (adenosine(37)-N6)-dimethylallyltransferase MiaA [Lachnospiraceae bacterium]